MSVLDRLFGSRVSVVAGYTSDDRPIFAAKDEKMCGKSGMAAYAASASGTGEGWCCLLRAGHTGGCWHSNPNWPPHYQTTAERDAALGGAVR